MLKRRGTTQSRRRTPYFPQTKNALNPQDEECNLPRMGSTCNNTYDMITRAQSPYAQSGGETRSESGGMGCARLRCSCCSTVACRGGRCALLQCSCFGAIRCRPRWRCTPRAHWWSDTAHHCARRAAQASWKKHMEAHTTWDRRICTRGCGGGGAGGDWRTDNIPPRDPRRHEHGTNIIIMGKNPRMLVGCSSAAFWSRTSS
jgi:hypothetical protein